MLWMVGKWVLICLGLFLAVVCGFLAYVFYVIGPEDDDIYGGWR